MSWGSGNRQPTEYRSVGPIHKWHAEGEHERAAARHHGFWRRRRGVRRRRYHDRRPRIAAPSAAAIHGLGCWYIYHSTLFSLLEAVCTYSIGRHIWKLDYLCEMLLGITCQRRGLCCMCKLLYIYTTPHTQQPSKVHIFWEGQKILRNVPRTFDYSTFSQK